MLSGLVNVISICVVVAMSLIKFYEKKISAKFFYEILQAPQYMGSFSMHKLRTAEGDGKIV